MHTQEIVKELERERDRLSQAIAALQDTRADGRVVGKSVGGKRRLSPEARKRISEAQKKRWAAQKKK